MYYYGIDIFYIILVVPTLLLSLWAQYKVNAAFSRYSKMISKKKITGRDAALSLLKTSSINDVAVESIKGSLTDHYDPRSKKLRLSESVFSQSSVAAIGVAAHEAGHAIQHATGYAPLVLRSTLVPVANIGSRFGPIMAIGGLIFTLEPLIMIGIILFSAAVLFYLVTLPVEFNASSRALSLLQSSDILSQVELECAKRVLTAAALTYVASALTAIMSLLRLILLSRGRRR